MHILLAMSCHTFDKPSPNFLGNPPILLCYYNSTRTVQCQQSMKAATGTGTGTVQYDLDSCHLDSCHFCGWG